MDKIQSIKQRFEIIGNDPQLNRAIGKAIRVSPTDISVLVTGESGVGKESIPRIIHQLSLRKHGKFIAVNCGAIPEGTIDSELFGHEKGAFTGATSTRSGYFEEADGGTIFLDEVGELPLTTQVRLLRVLENGEFLKVGSSQVQKTNVRIVAATNLDMPKAIQQGKFREDLFYRLSTVEIVLPPLRERNGDIHLLFRKFAADFAQKYKMPTVRLDEQAQQLLERQQWHGNIRQLRNVAEQLSVLEQDRAIGVDTLGIYLPDHNTRLPAVVPSSAGGGSDFGSEREILYKVLFDMKSDLNDLKQLTLELMNSSSTEQVRSDNEGLIQKIYGEEQNQSERLLPPRSESNTYPKKVDNNFDYAEEIEEEETLSLIDKELELIKKALERNNGKRKAAADELGISERTLYRKIKQFDIDL
ncbi:MAG: sigma-54-dependent Fis family transcriptional regulator [Flavobacteriaceae bacterium]|nr:sigma-54-dependent Fis family transcriptional regulator [Flavobacteriaceae bacterium]|tara:strand:+ start:1244 stop:2488 length:1245 start_codon:yes stop_codon:yes gene_type:complete